MLQNFLLNFNNVYHLYKLNGTATLQYAVKKTAYSFGKQVKAQVIFYRSKTYCL